LKKSKTSSFGVPKREGHDSRPFYERAIYQDSLPQTTSRQENVRPPEEVLDQVYNHSSEAMGELPDCCVDLMVTSPPYNTGKDYDQDLTMEEYLGFLERVLRETYRVLKEGARVAVNVANLGRKPYIPLHAHLVMLCQEIGFLMRGEIIWDKSTVSGSCAWGSWLSPANPVLRDTHEYILVFSKGKFGRQDTSGREATISRDEFLAYTQSIWRISPERARRIGHPAPFPLELPMRLINLYTFTGDLVLDPFLGSGTTALAALRSRRRFVGYEINPVYVDMAYARLAADK
jgi:DNA modification methylase